MKRILFKKIAPFLYSNDKFFYSKLLSATQKFTYTEQLFKAEKDDRKRRSEIKNNGFVSIRAVTSIQEDINYHFTEQLFHLLINEDGKVPVNRILKTFKNMGLWTTDPRLSETMLFLREHFSDSVTDMRKYDGTGNDAILDYPQFKKAIEFNSTLFKKAFTGDMIIPDFPEFCERIKNLYTSCAGNKDGRIADYIPQLSKFKPESWGVSICTIDGQRFSVGDVNSPFTLQSSSKPFSYALCIDENGADKVHSYIGYEPSGDSFNSIKLDSNLKPHNPFINSGAILVSSMIKNGQLLGDRFDHIQNKLRLIAGNEAVGFNNSVYLSEKATANRNLSLAYFMQEHRCFPPNTSLEETLNLYFMTCSVEVNTNTAAVMAGTLANGGVCPITGQGVLSPISVRNCLALMHSCGMYDYSGRFAFKVGLPAKSAVSGCIILVIPNIAGICLWSPPLDSIGNSVRGVQFCEQLVNVFNFHNYDNLSHTTEGSKLDPRARIQDNYSSNILALLFSACNGDCITLRRLALAGQNMSMADYDNRTALHIAASEGHLDCVQFLVDRCKADASVKDRWGNTPADNAAQFEHREVEEYLLKVEEAKKEMKE